MKNKKKRKTSDEKKVEIIIVNYSDEDNKENTEKTSCEITVKVFLISLS